MIMKQLKLSTEDKKRCLETNKRLCSKCLKEKDFSKFAKSKNGSFGIASFCIECRKKYARGYYHANPDKINEIVRRKRLNKNEEINKKEKELRIQKYLTIEGFANKMFKSSKRRAKVTNKEYNLTYEFIYNKLKPLICEVTNFPLTIEYIHGNKLNPLSPSLDRIDSSKGYTQDNTQITCLWWNLSKNNWKEEIIINLIDKFYESRHKNN